MSKIPHKKNQSKQKKETLIDEQNQPCCRATWKKIRNVNKKLAQIQDLQKRDDLKPQQVQKVNRKQGLLDEKSKYQEFLEFYKNTITQNAQAYRQQQMKQLTNLAQALALASYSKSNSQTKTNQLTHLLSLIQNSSPNQTVQERSRQLSQAFINLASDRKFRQQLSKSFNENANKTYNVKQQKQEKPKVQDSPKKSKNTHKVETPKPQKVQEKEQQQIKLPEPISEVKTQVVAVNDTPVEKKQNQEQKPIENSKKEDENKQGRQRGPRGPRGPPREGNRDNNNRRKYNNDRRKYKPKNEQKEGEKNEDQSSSDSEEKQYQFRDFKREQVRQLIEDGFVVVGKPKIKSHEQKQWHDHTHGRKHHHHHAKQNY